MKKILILLVILFSVFSCVNHEKINERKFMVSFSNDGRWTSSRVYCDSFKMASREKIVIYVDGVALDYYSKDILVYTNTESQ